MAVAVNSAYADDFAASIQDSLYTMTDLRNDYLIERYFGELYTAPQTAAVETVKSAIELYELTGADPYVPVAVRGTLPGNQAGMVAFDVINSMNTDRIVYPFVVDANTLRVVAEGAFPATVGLSAFFLNDADRPWEAVMEDLRESDGVWVTYAFVNHNTGISEDKRVWLSLHDGYIFGAGYHEVRDDDALDRVSSMIQMYDADGVDSFAAVSGMSFVLDAGTLEAVAHTDASGSAVKDALDTLWDLEFLSETLDKHGSLWVSYPSTDAQSGSEYVRAHLRLHDGYVFGSGYGVTAEERLQSLVDEAIRLYDLGGENALETITQLKWWANLAVLTVESNTVAAYIGHPEFVGLRLSNNLIDQDPEVILEYLKNNPGLWSDTIAENFGSPQELRGTAWLVLHDGYYFTIQDIYSPEEAAIGVVNEAIELYKTYGEGAFDRITWQSVVPEIIYPFVFDAETWRTVAHGGYPDRLGLLPAAIIADHDLDEVSKMLAENEGVWLSYEFYNPVTNVREYKRAWLSTHDGYTFAAGYYYGNFESMERTIQNVIDVYEAQGRDAAFAGVNAMMQSGLEYPFVMDRETLDIVAHGQNPNLVGANFEDKALTTLLSQTKIENELHNDGDTTFSIYLILDPATNTTEMKITLFQLHDGYVVSAGQSVVYYTR